MNIRTEAIQWPVKWQDKEPKDWSVPTYVQQRYLRSVMLYYVAQNVSEGDILINLWKTGYIEFNDDWLVWRHPIFVYKNFCKMQGFNWKTKWNEEFNGEDWEGVL